jgi:hypothetical protein
MTNHYHLLVETPDGNLSKGMRQLNGVFTQQFNRRHGRVGHVFQGRYKAILVQRDSYLLELSRYVAGSGMRYCVIKPSHIVAGSGMRYCVIKPSQTPMSSQARPRWTRSFACGA